MKKPKTHSTNSRTIPISILLLTLFIAPLKLMAANNKLDSLSTYQKVEGSYIIGGQVYNDNFIYNPGTTFQASMGFHINKDIAVGFGAGYMAFEDEKFIPIFAEVMGYKKKKKNTPFIKMQMGYSIGWNDSFPANINYEYRGGGYIDVGMGRKININDNYALLFQWSYRHQFAFLEYETFGSEEYSQNLNYDMIVITLGLMFNQ